MSNLSAHQAGNMGYVNGTVGHGFDEETEQEKRDRAAKGTLQPTGKNIHNFNAGAIGSDAARDLEPIGAAKPFRMQYERLQDLDAEVEFQPGGGLLVRKAKWGAIR